MKKHYLITIFFIMVIKCCYATNHTYSSSKKSSFKIQKQQDSLKLYFQEASSHLIKSEKLIYADLDSSLWHCKQGVALAKKSQNDSLIIRGNFLLGVNYYYNQDNTNAKKYLNISKAIAENQDNMIAIYNTYNFLGAIYGGEKNYNKSIEHFKEALNSAQKLNDTIKTATIYTNLGAIYTKSGNKPLAKYIYEKAFIMVENYNSKKSQSRKENPLYFATQIDLKYNLANIEENDSIAIQIFEGLIKELKNPESALVSTKMLTYKGLGLRFHDENFTKAESYYQKALGISLQIGSKNPVPYLDLATLHFDHNKYDSAKNYLDLYLNSSVEFNETDRVKINRFASSLYTKTKEYEKAIPYYENYITLVDSIEKKNKEDLYIEFGKKFETEQKEKEIVLTQLKLNKETHNKKNIILLGLFIGSGMLFIFTSIYFYIKSKKKKTTLELKKQQEFNRFRTNFLENVSHEVRTPLTLIIGYLNLIKKEAQNSESTMEYADIALRSSTEVLNDVNEILTLLKNEKKKLRLNKDDQHLNKFIEDAFFNYKYKAQQEHQTLLFKTNVSNDLIVKFDYEKLKIILNNLISNALKYSEQGSKVTLEIKLSSKSLHIIVNDQGIGIDTTEIDHVFSRYYQTANNNTTGGIGIGLSLVKELVKFLNGTISVESELGKGSVFHVKLPVIVNNIKQFITEKESEFCSDTKSTSTDKTYENTRPKLLLVEDDKPMAQYLDKILIPHFNCDIVHSGFEALEIVKEKKYDLILSDLQMQGMSGFEFKTTLNKIKGYETIPFIILTANTFSDTKIESLTIGINDYMTKPFNEKELIARIKNLLQNKSIQIKYIHRFDENDILIDESGGFNVRLVHKLTEIVHNNLSDDTFKVGTLAFECNYSQRQLTRLLNKTTGMSPVKFILEVRLLKAYEFIQNNTLPTIKEVMYSVGITSPAYFSKKFTERFGTRPTKLYLKNNPKSN